MSQPKQDFLKLDSAELAKWLRKQDDTSMWTVDGDLFLTERLTFPCFAEEIAGALEKRKTPLFLLNQGRSSPGVEITASQIENHVGHDQGGERVLQLTWKSPSDEPWLLIEDHETVKLYEKMTGTSK